MNILIIGSGAWPTKIFNGLFSKSRKDIINQISAREFLSQNSFEYKFFDCIWIATSPENQISILEGIADYSKVVILEKPLFTTVSEHERFYSAMKVFNGIAQMSTIWLFSPLWKNLKVSLDNISSILIKHTYSGRRIYCSPIFDWVPHDLYLLSDLGLNIHQASKLQVDDSSQGKTSILFEFESKSSVEIIFEKSKLNNFSWEIENHDSSRIRINFTDRCFEEIKEGTTTISHFDKPDFNSADAMLRNFLTTTSSNLQNLIDSHFYLLNNLPFTKAPLDKE